MPYVLCLLLFPLLISCQSAEHSTQKPENGNSFPNKVVLIIIDTLRADHLPFYGYEKNTAPFMNELSKESLVAEHMVATSSFTAPATASIHTGLYPPQHGVLYGRNMTRNLKKSFPETKVNRLPKDALTFADVLKAEGYATFGVTDNGNISRELGFDQSFDNFQMYKNEGALKVHHKIDEWKEQINKEDKYFLYIHYMDPHAPYEMHTEQFLSKSSKSRKARMIAAYDSEIWHTDKHIKKLFDMFHLKDDSLVLITSDHGEEFYEHGRAGHGKTLYKEVIDVPLMFYSKTLDLKGRVSKSITQVDIFPTLLNLLGKEKPASLPGVSILNSDKKSERSLFSFLYKKLATGVKRDDFSVVQTPWHYIREEKSNWIETDKEKNIKEELFDTDKDKTEQHNLSEKEDTSRFITSYRNAHNSWHKLERKYGEIKLNKEP